MRKTELIEKIINNIPNVEVDIDKNIVRPILSELIDVKSENFLTKLGFDTGDSDIPSFVHLGNITSINQLVGKRIVTGNIVATDFPQEDESRFNDRDIESLCFVGGQIDFSFFRALTNLPNLRYVGNKLNLRLTGITNLPLLSYIGDTLLVSSCEKLESIPSLKYIGGSCTLYNCSALKSLPSLNVLGKRAIKLQISGCVNIEKFPQGLTIFNDSTITHDEKTNKETVADLEERFPNCKFFS